MKNIILITAGIFWMLQTQAQPKQQTFTMNDGKSGRISMEATPVLNNTFILKIKVDWLNESMQTIIDNNSVVVLHKKDFKYDMPEMILCKCFEGTDYLTINASAELPFTVSESFRGGIVNFESQFRYAASASDARSASGLQDFTFSRPQRLRYTKEITAASIQDKTPPLVEVIEPKSRGFKPIVQENTVKIIVKATDHFGIEGVNMNGRMARSIGNDLYEADVTLSTGSNKVVIQAKDKNGLITRMEIEVESTFQEEFSIGVSKYFALIIGVSDYDDPLIQDLDKPVSDASNLYNLLTSQYTFDVENTTFLQNPTLEDIIIELDRLADLVTVDDNLMIFYAGHGHWDPRRELGYWLPRNAQKANTANWLRNSTLRDYLHAIKSKHTLLVADACFSGGIFKTRSAFTEADAAVQKLYELPSRKAITSGTLTEVPDQSVFMDYFMRRLTDNQLKFLPSEKLFASFREAVLNNSPTVPQYGTIQGTGDEGGDFIFIRR